MVNNFRQGNEAFVEKSAKAFFAHLLGTYF
jgi:hypothetical protein